MIEYFKVNKYNIFRNFVFLCFLLISSSLFAQVSNQNGEQSSSKEQRHMVDSFIQLSSQYQSTYPEKGSKYAMDALILAENINYPKGKFKAYLAMAEYETLSGDYVKAMDYNLKALTIAQNVNSKADQAFAMNKVGDIYLQILDVENALQYYQNSLEIYQELNDRLGICKLIISIGSCYGISGNFSKSIEYYDQALGMAYQTKDTLTIIRVLVNMGNSYSYSDFDKGLEKYQQALELGIKLDDKITKSNVYNNMGNMYRMNGYIDEAIVYTDKARQEAEDIQYKKILAMSLYNLGGLYAEKAEYTIAEHYYDQAKKIADGIGLKEVQIKILYGLSSIYKDTKNFEKAKKYYTEALNEENEQKKLNSAARIANLQAIYDLAGKDRQLQRLEAEKQQNQIKTLLLIAACIILVFSAILLFSRFKMVKKRNLLLIKERDLEQKELEQEKNRNRLIEEQIQVERKRHEVDMEQVVVEKQRSEMQLEQITLEKQAFEMELEMKNRELVSATMQTLQKNEIFSDLRKHVVALKTESSPQLIDEIIRIIDNSLRLEKDWETFLLHFTSVHPNFFDLLKQKHPDLTEKDIKHCAYIKIGLSVKEIASLMNISVRGVEKSRTKMKLKMNLDKDDNIYNYLQGF